MAKKETTELTYTEQRLKLLGITKEFNRASIVVNDTSSFPHQTTTKEAEWFCEYDPNKSDKEPNPMLEGAMQFLYLNLDGTQQDYRTPDNRNAKHYHIYRLHPTKATKERKYFQAAKSGSHLFHTPGIVWAYTNRIKVKRLYLIEGQLKAFAAWQAGYVPAQAGKIKKGKATTIPEQHNIQIMGMMGITQAGDAEYTKEQREQNPLKQIITGKTFHDDILEYCRVCQPDELVIVFDADCLSMPSWDKENEPNKDLGKRANSFFNALRNIREYAKGIVKDVYFTHVKEDFLLRKIKPGVLDDVVKGLDDLLIYAPSHEKVIDDLERLTQAKTYFDCMNISSEHISKLKGYFLLNTYKGVPRAFYDKFESIINQTPFNFLGSKYQSTPEGLKMLRHNDSQQFKRIGCDYVKEIYVPNSLGVPLRKLMPWKKAEIKADYVDAMGIKNFMETIDKYDAPCSVPQNDPEKYQQDIETTNGGKAYNLYYKVDHEIVQGDWSASEEYFKHVFQDKYDVWLDWLCLTYRNPNQKLPVICLVSSEKNTGKSTLLWYLRELYKENVTVIGNAELNDNFNDDYVTKLIVGIDEAIFEKQQVIEKLKSWVTSYKVKMNAKFMSRVEVDFFAKFIITSNNEDTFIKIDDDEARFWINKVPVINPEKRDPLLLDKLKAEIPAVIHYLKNEHVMKYAYKDRLYFAKEVTDTEALRKLKTQSVTWGTKHIRDFVTNAFKDLQQVDLYFTRDELLYTYDSKSKKEGAYFHKCLTQEMELESRRFRAPKFEIIDESGNYFVVSKTSSPLHYYHFKVEDFLTINEYNLFVSTEELIKIRNGELPWSIEKRPLKYEETAHAAASNDLPF